MQLCSLERLQEKVQHFSQYGANANGGITRLSLTGAALQARAEFCRRCNALGMTSVTDDMGNIYATMQGSEKLPAIVVGSHLDSVENGGNYDGVLGVLAGLELAETLHSAKKLLRHPLTILVWTNEEGARFDPAMMSSGVLAGKFEKEDMLASSDKNGVPFGQALAQSGYEGDVGNRLTAENCAAYFELHIEQGPVLEMGNVSIGVVSGVVGMVNYEICVTGTANHAGTTPQNTRQDALYASSQLVTDLWERLAPIAPDLVFTIGRFTVLPNIHTVIPGQVRFTLDARHQEEAVLQQVVEVLQNLPEHKVGCKVEVRQLWQRKTVEFAPRLVEAIQTSCDNFGYTNRRLYSGAGHDAQYMASLVPSAMIFVPSKQGRSHCPEEYTSPQAIWKGANVLLAAVFETDENTAIEPEGQCLR